MDAIAVRHNETAAQFEVQQDDLLAVLQYDRANGQLVLLRTEVPAPLEGRGIGSALVRAALAYAQEQELWMVPRCPFVRLTQVPVSCGTWQCRPRARRSDPGSRDLGGARR